MSYAQEVTTQYPFIEWEGTGGNCDCLTMQTHDGGWLVLSQDCVVPESADETDCVALVKYPFNDEGWGADGECGDQVLIGATAGECVEYMVNAKRDPDSMNEYQLFWGEAYPALDHYDSRQRAIFFFTQDNGFESGDQDKVRALEIVRAITFDSGMAGEHVTVVRVK